MKTKESRIENSKQKIIEGKPAHHKLIGGPNTTEEALGRLKRGALESQRVFWIFQAAKVGTAASKLLPRNSRQRLGARKVTLFYENLTVFSSFSDIFLSKWCPLMIKFSYLDQEHSYDWINMYFQINNINIWSSTTKEKN